MRYVIGVLGLGIGAYLLFTVIGQVFQDCPEGKVLVRGVINMVCVQK